MKNPKLDKILSQIRKPSRYINCELNSYPPDMAADFSVCLCFPDIYEIGASNLGLEILYHLINEKKLARCERSYAPDIDLEKILRNENVPLFSLESNSALNSFDVLGFTIQCELAASNIVNMIDLAGISHFAADRGDGEPLIIGGGPALTNPEPFCDFFDLFVLGDGEDPIVEIIDICRKFKNKVGRCELLMKLSEIEGVYVPSLYEVKYNADKTIRSVSPISANIKPSVKKRVLDLKNAYFPSKKIVPFVETVHNRLNIEAARGCPGQCRFCQASKYYRPWRQRPIEALLDLVKSGLENTGYEEIAFSSLSCSDYKGLDKLLIEVNKLYQHSRLNISLPSLRCHEQSIKIAQYINRDKKPTLTFAPEAGTNRLRNVIGKYLSEGQILRTVLAAHSLGWETIKLYFMIGLPTETYEDLEGISGLLKSIKLEAKGMKFTLTVSPFVPKAQTPFQWAAMDASDEIEKKIKFLGGLHLGDLKAHNSRASVLEALIALGDRRLSKVIYRAWLKGARFDQWSDRLRDDIWMQALRENDMDLAFYVYRKKEKDEVFAWDHLDFGASKETLYNEYIKGINEGGEIKEDVFAQKSELPLTFEKAERPENIAPQMRIRLRFSKKGALKFISHLEQIEALRRAIRRTKLPIAFSAGFSPQIKASFGPPLPVGYESLSEYVDLSLTENTAIDEIKRAISKTLPLGFELLDVKQIPVSFPSSDALANIAEFKISNFKTSQKEIDDFLKQDKIIVKIIKKEKVLEIDAKPIIKEMKVEDGALLLRLYIGQDKSIKPDLLIAAMGRGGDDLSIERTKLLVEISDGKVFEL
jgi:radical SAM family uncharacterized protein/radical SAM-linked protein